MRRLSAAALLALAASCQSTGEPTALVVHDVYFDLNDASPEAVQELVDGCHDYLGELPGIAHFAAGARVAEREGPVNDLDFDVSLHVWFTDHASYESYDTDPQHLEFIETFRENWAGVRVFDSDVTGG